MRVMDNIRELVARSSSSLYGRLLWYPLKLDTIFLNHHPATEHMRSAQVMVSMSVWLRSRVFWCSSALKTSIQAQNQARSRWLLSPNIFQALTKASLTSMILRRLTWFLGWLGMCPKWWGIRCLVESVTHSWCVCFHSFLRTEVGVTLRSFCTLLERFRLFVY